MAGLSTTPAYRLPNYTFTGQYSYLDDPSTAAVTEGFGLMFYVSRMYDPALGRFAQADSIVPPGVQGWDRYAAMNNNPVRYVDPSGHLSCDNANAAEEGCGDFWTIVEEDYGIKFVGEWDIRYKRAVYEAVRLVANAFTNVMRGDPAENFAEVYKTKETTLTFTWGNCALCEGGGGYTYSYHDIRFESMAAVWRPDYFLRSVNNVIHELGHAFNAVMGGAPVESLTRDMTSNPLLERGSNPFKSYGFASPNNQRTWVQNSSSSESEVFADQFLGWVRNTWERLPNNRYDVWTDTGKARSAWMTTNMAEWLTP
jgi:RHS repeat-associated protein